MATTILIASYYRSGTSALSGALNLAGVDIVTTEEQNEHNPRGYFENPALARLDLELFRRLGRDWHDIRLMPEQWHERPDIGADTQRIVTELRDKHGASPLWAVKHPHLCRLLPIYEDAATRVGGSAPGIIHIYRDPWVVAHSQLKKNGLSRAHALLLWTSYVLDAERYARHLRRVVLDYELLVKDARQALRRIGSQLEIDFPRQSSQDWRNVSTFLTPHLRRSRPQGRDSTPQAVRRLVEDVWEAALGEAAPARFDELRERFKDECALLDELASSQLAVTAGLNTGFKKQRSQPEDTDHLGAEGSPLRPPERTDIAERQRLLHELAQQAPMPTIGIVVAVPAGRVESAFETARSIESQWHPPQAVRYLCADPDAPQRESWSRVDDSAGALTQALADQLPRLATDYVAIIDAGDRIEPDACARLSLFAKNCGQPALLYTDEIVANTKNPWIRHKPDFDIERLRSLHYLGGWLWYKTDFLRQGAALDGSLPGAEDFDVALRAFEAGQAVRRLPEALYARTPDSRRDRIPVDDVRTHAKRALSTHLSRCGAQPQATLHEGVVPGSFVVRHEPIPGKRISLVLLCNEAEASHGADLDPARLAQASEALGIDHMVCAAFGRNLDPEIDAALTNLDDRNPLPERLHVVRAEHEGQMLIDVAEQVGSDAVVLLSLNASTSDAHWLGHLQGKLYGNDQPVGMVGTRAHYPAPDGSQRLLGPLILGGGDGVGIIGLGRTADDPGPGGWLLGAHSVDGVAPPCLAIRGDLFKQLSINPTLSGAPLWLDLSLQVWQKDYRVVWDPSVDFACPDAPSYTRHTGEEIKAGNRALRRLWGCSSTRHHPMLALQGDNLTPLGNPGLCAPAPRGRPHALLSGTVAGAEYAVEWLRAARMSAELTASWSAEPVAITEVRRLAPEAWLRINPETPVTAVDAPPWQALYTRPPAQMTPLRAIGEQTQRSFATSPTLASALRKRSHNRLRPELILPRLPARLWSDFSSAETIGRHQLRVLWVDEGEPPDWIVELLNIRQIQWFVVEGGHRHYDGPIATFERPSDENGWYELFRTVSPHAVIRPAQDATWMDCQLLLRGGAASAALYADPRLHWPDALPVTGVASRFDDWRRALERMRSDPEALCDAGRRARDAVEQVGWIEDDAVADMLLINDWPHKHLRHEA